MTYTTTSQGFHQQLYVGLHGLRKAFVKPLFYLYFFCRKMDLSGGQAKDPSLGKINPVLYLLWKNPFEWGYLPVPLPFLLLLVVDEVVYPKKRRRIREGLCYSHSHLSLTWGWRRTKWRKSLLGTMSLCCVEMNHLLKIGFYWKLDKATWNLIAHWIYQNPMLMSWPKKNAATFSLWPSDSEKTFIFGPHPSKKTLPLWSSRYSLQMTISLK